MDNENNNIDLIERYVLGQMQTAELEEFEQQLANTPELEEEVRLFEVALQSIQQQGLKNKLAAIHEEVADTGRSSRIYWVGIAASVSLIAFIAYFLLFNTPSEKALFAKNFSPYENIVTARGSGQLNAAMVYYSTGQYEKAINEFESVLTDSVNHQVLFYKGISHLAINQADQAIPIFKSLDGSTFHQQARWYLGLAYLASDQTALARETFIAIGPEDYQYSAAQSILKHFN